MNPHYEVIDIDKITLDYNNPRIARIIENYKGGPIPSEAISIALGRGEDSYNTLKESIKTSSGIIHPIIVNKLDDSTYVVIEGNTRVQIYKEFLADGVVGEWTKIGCIVYENLDREQIHAIRLQSHLVGPRDWEPYSKAKYLNYLYNIEKLPISLILSYCGNNNSEVFKMINAYNDMERHYRPNLKPGMVFDPQKFSFFKEAQNKTILDCLVANHFTKDDFAKWVINGNIDKATNVRLLPAILRDAKARDVFLQQDIVEAHKYVVLPGLSEGLLKDATYDQLAAELTKKLLLLPYYIMRSLKHDPAFLDKKNRLFEALDQLKETCGDLLEEE